MMANSRPTSFARSAPALAAFLAAVMWAASVLAQYSSPSPLAGIRADVQAAAALVLADGAPRFVPIRLDRPGLVLLSPAYASLVPLGQQFGLDPKLVANMQDQVNANETGHLFLIRDGALAGHQALPGLAEPVLAALPGQHVILRITREETSNRPVRLVLEAGALGD